MVTRFVQLLGLTRRTSSLQPPLDASGPLARPDEAGRGSPEVLVVEDLAISVGGRQILSRVDLSVRCESLAVIGPSGAGKTSLLNAVLGFQPMDQGRIIVDGLDVGKASRAQLAQMRRESVGVVFQSGELVDELSPAENVAVPALLAGQPMGEARSRAEQLLRSLGLATAARSVLEFSGGERQRTAVARALVNGPRLLLADEPTGSLDPLNRDAVADLILSMPAQHGVAVVIVTHDETVARRADRLVTIEGGCLVEQTS